MNQRQEEAVEILRNLSKRKDLTRLERKALVTAIVTMQAFDPKMLRPRMTPYYQMNNHPRRLQMAPKAVYSR